MTFDPRDFLARFMAAMEARDYATVESMTHPDFVASLPQSGEQVQGVRSWAEQMSIYPDADQIVSETENARFVGDEARYAMSPAYTVVPLAGSNEYTISFRTRYPDGSWWYLVSILEMRDGKLYGMETYFAPELPAPLAESIAAYAHG